MAWSRPPAVGGVGVGVPLRCEAPVLVEGELRCAGEWPLDLGRWCQEGGEPGPVVPVEVRAGDAVERRAACRRGELGRIAPDELAALELPVDLNAASPAELASLPGIGPALARRIVESRPYAEVDGLVGVRGIGPKTLARLRRRSRTGPGPILFAWESPSPGR